MLKTDHTVWCWGYALGNNMNVPVGMATQVPGLPPDVVQIVSDGASRTVCALTMSGAVWCWGANDQGQAGDGNTNQVETVPVQSSISNVVALGFSTDTGSGADMVWARKSNGSIWVWGAVVLAGGTSCTSVTTPTPTQFTGPNGPLMNLQDVQLVHQGSPGWVVYAYLITHANGSVEAMVLNPAYPNPSCGGLGSALIPGCTPQANGQYCAYFSPDGYADATYSYMTQLGGLDVVLSNVTGPIRFIDPGAALCGLTAGGLVECWGGEEEGLLGNGSDAGATNYWPPPVTLMNPSILTSIGPVKKLSVFSGKAASSCALNTSGQIWCWGPNEDLQSGTGSDNSPNLVPVRPSTTSGFDTAIDVTGGPGFVCALDKSGQPWCWGQVGTAIGGASSQYPIPYKLSAPCP